MTSGPGTRRSPRLAGVDVVRGAALCGVVLVNVVGLTGMQVPRSWVYEAFLHQRFFPLFSFLFGVSFTLFLRAADGRTGHPRLVLLARLGFLVPMGMLHRVLQPDEVLLSYAVVGVVVLLPASFLPRSVVFVSGVAATAGALAVSNGGSMLIPGLFLVGSAAARYGVFERQPETFAVKAFAVSAGLTAVALNAWQAAAGVWPDESPLPAMAGIVTGAAYAATLVVLLGTGARRFLLAALEPLGRTALTCYLGATVLVVAADQVVEPSGYAWAAALGTGVLLVEWVFARWWLRRFRYGPAEWVWRCLTWWRIVPMAVPSGSCAEGTFGGACSARACSARACSDRALNPCPGFCRGEGTHSCPDR